eukprot:GEZU01017747.1.p1 GENE.GEZU01017747.1~~GEZU01017747.1.p1  ORF type:complete len:223 (+),score=44.32 GEZU01017747.1:72-740(+)
MSELVVKEKISEEVTCAICLELFEDPRLLNCLHTFCKACCIKIANNNAIVCPTCRKTTELQPKRLANNNYNNLDEIDNAYEHQDINLPSNWIVANIVLHLNQQQQQLQQQAHKNNSPAANNNKADSNSVYYCGKYARSTAQITVSFLQRRPLLFANEMNSCCWTICLPTTTSIPHRELPRGKQHARDQILRRMRSQALRRMLRERPFASKVQAPRSEGVCRF